MKLRTFRAISCCFNKPFFAIAGFTIAGCAQQPVIPEKQLVPVVAEVEMPTRAFDTETLYALMVAELAGSRDRLDIMLSNYVAQAIETQDIGITERAALLANFAQDSVAAQQMTSQWSALAPDNAQAHYMAMSALSEAGRYFEAFDHGQYLIEHQQLPHGLDSLAVKATQNEASNEDLITLLKLYEAQAFKNPKDAELALAISFLEYQLDLLENSLKSAHRAQNLKQDYEQAYIQELRILTKMDPKKAQEKLQEVVAMFPENKRLRLQFARNLTQDNLPAAAVQFEELLKQSPGDNNIQLALALTYYQQDAFEQAKQNFLPLERARIQAPTANYYLGKIAQQNGDIKEAIRYYSQVPPSKEFLPAMAKAVDLMHKNNQAEEALQLITSYQLTAESSYQEGLSLLLADHYRNLKNYQAAEFAFNNGLKQFPRSQSLLFSRAMFMAGQQRMQDAENDLKTLLAINPNNADALNTLGYMLADANIRVPEAMGYIQRALALEPDNPAVIDSLGWALFRQGKTAEAIPYLRKAMQLMPNDEIAAHLGEALWVDGQKEEAMQIWKDGLLLNPDSRFIIDCFERFKLLQDS